MYQVTDHTSPSCLEEKDGAGKSIVLIICIFIYLSSHQFHFKSQLKNDFFLIRTILYLTVKSSFHSLFYWHFVLEPAREVVPG